MPRTRFTLSASVFVIVRRDDEVLLLRRANTGWHDGDYSLPAGALDGGETLQQAAARELREETGLHAQPADMRLVHTLHCHSGDSGGEWLGFIFLAEHWQGEPALEEADKHDDLRWFPLADLPDRLIPYTRQGIEGMLGETGFSSYGWAA